MTRFVGGEKKRPRHPSPCSAARFAPARQPAHCLCTSVDKLDRSEQEGHERISQDAERARKKLTTRSDERAHEARAKIDQRERDRHDTKKIQTSREKVAQHEEKAQAKLAGKLGK